MTPATIDAIQNCLALEHEALWVYGYLGGRIPALQDQAREAFDEHRRARDRLIALLDRAGADRPAPLTAYLLGTARNLKQASAIARALEDKGVAGWLTVVGTSEGEDRRFAITMMRRAALASLRWGGKPVAFPGLPA